LRNISRSSPYDEAIGTYKRNESSIPPLYVKENGEWYIFLDDKGYRGLGWCLSQFYDLTWRFWYYCSKGIAPWKP